MFIIIGIGVGVVDLYRNPFRIQLLIGIGIVPTDGLLGFRGMGEFTHAVTSPHDHIFRFAIDPGIAGLRVILDGDDFIVLTHDQIALGIVSGIGIRSLSRICIPIIFDFSSSRSRRIIGIGCCCLSPIRDGKERRRQDKGCQNGGFTTAPAATAAYVTVVMALGQFRHDDVTISCFTPNNFKDFIHSTSPLSEYIS